MVSPASSEHSHRDQPWSDEAPEHGSIVLVTDNPVSHAIAEIAATLGRRSVVLPDEDVEESPLEWLTDHPLTERDALVLCAHDTPDLDALLHHAMEGRAGYVAMLASRSRAEQTFAALADEFSAETLERMHMPAGLNTGGKAPGEMALSVVAEIVAWSYGRPGGPMRRDLGRA